MRRFALLATLAGVAAVATAVASASAKQTPPPPSPQAATATVGAGQDLPPVQVRWLDAYGTFNVRQGSWNFIPDKLEGC
jgi:hypothetical protein